MAPPSGPQHSQTTLHTPTPHSPSRSVDIYTRVGQSHKSFLREVGVTLHLPTMSTDTSRCDPLW